MQKDIRYIQAALAKVEEDSVLKFLIDIMADGVKDAENFVPNKTYRKNDKIYIHKDNKHHVYKCIVDISTPGAEPNIAEEWSDLYY